MGEPTIVFHFPLPIQVNGSSGSQVRPLQMLRAFEEIGYRVELVAGYGKERATAAKRVLTRMASGEQSFEFVYSESSTQPTLLTERNHLPTHPLLDFGFLRRMRKHGIPVGLYYRDIHWRMDYYSSTVSLGKRLVTMPMYNYDLVQYRLSVSHLFLPSMEMLNAIPFDWPESSASALPPGCVIQDVESAVSSDLSRGTSLLFVGGIVPPLYDLRPALNAIGNMPNVHLTVCCRQAEWEAYRSFYLPLPQNVTFVHASGKSLSPLYAASHAVLILGDHPYYGFAVPVKFSEALGYGKPAIVIGETPLAAMVEEQGTGWKVHSAEQLPELIRVVGSSPDAYSKRLTAVRAAQMSNTWESRTRQVQAVMSTYTSRE